MGKKRFLRDGVLDDLIMEARNLLAALSQDFDNDLNLLHYVNSILISYETCKVTLERIEEAIERARPNDPTGEVFVPLCEAATHIKTGVFSLHETLWRNLEPIRKELEIEFDDFESLLEENYLHTE